MQPHLKSYLTSSYSSKESLFPKEAKSRATEMLSEFPWLLNLASLYSWIHFVVSEITLLLTYQKALHSTLLNNEVGGGRG